MFNCSFQAAGAISTPDDKIIAALVKLANEDHSWKVKAHSINGKIFQYFFTKRFVPC